MRASVGSVVGFQQFHETLALQGEEPVFGDGLRDVGGAAGQHRGDLAGDGAVVRQRHALQRETLDRQVERRPAVRARQVERDRLGFLVSVQ